MFKIFYQDKPPATLSKKYPPPATQSSILSTKVCDGIIDCSLDRSDELNCKDSGRHYCSAGNAISIPVESLCDGIVDCDDKSDEDFSSCNDRFFCTSLEGRRVKKLVVYIYFTFVTLINSIQSILYITLINSMQKEII